MNDILETREYNGSIKYHKASFLTTYLERNGNAATIDEHERDLSDSKRRRHPLSVARVFPAYILFGPDGPLPEN